MKVNINTIKISLGLLCPIFLSLAQSVAFAEDQPAFTLSKDVQAHVAKGEKPVIRVSYHDVSNEFAPFIKKGVEKAASDFNVDAQLGRTGGCGCRETGCRNRKSHSKGS